MAPIKLLLLLSISSTKNVTKIPQPMRPLIIRMQQQRKIFSTYANPYTRHFSQQYSTYHRLPKWCFMLGVTVAGSMVATHSLDAQVLAYPKIAKHHFICDYCYRLNGFNKDEVNYVRTRCYRCGKNLVIFEKSFYKNKENFKTVVGLIDPTGIVSGAVKIVDGATAGNLSTIAAGTLNLVSLGISEKLGVSKKMTSNALKLMELREWIVNQLKKEARASKMSVYHLYPDLDKEDVMKVINSIDCISHCKDTDSRLVRSLVATVDTVALSVVTVPFDLLKGTIAMLAGGVKTVAEGGNLEKNCNDEMAKMGGWTTGELISALEKFVKNAEDK